MTHRITRPLRETALLFSGLAEPYDQVTRTVEWPATPITRWLEDNLGTGCRALDAGCGTGRDCSLLAERYDNVLGIDAAPGMIQFAARERAHPNVRYEVRDIFAVIPERDGRFDTVLAFSFVLHAGSPGVVLRHLLPLVAPGGRLLIVESQRPPAWGQNGWQNDFAFMSARAAFDESGDLDDAVSALRTVLNPDWLHISQLSAPPTHEEFFTQYAAALPGAKLAEEDSYFTACWRASA